MIVNKGIYSANVSVYIVSASVVCVILYNIYKRIRASVFVISQTVHCSRDRVKLAVTCAKTICRAVIQSVFISRKLHRRICGSSLRLLSKDMRSIIRKSYSSDVILNIYVDSEMIIGRRRGPGSAMVSFGCLPEKIPSL